MCGGHGDITSGLQLLRDHLKTKLLKQELKAEKIQNLFERLAEGKKKNQKREETKSQSMVSEKKKMRCTGATKILWKLYWDMIPKDEYGNT